MSKRLTIRLPEELAKWVDERAEATGLSPARFVTLVLEEARRGRAQVFRRLAGSVEGPADLSVRRGFSSRLAG